MKGGLIMEEPNNPRPESDKRDQSNRNPDTDQPASGGEKPDPKENE